MLLPSFIFVEGHKIFKLRQRLKKNFWILFVILIIASQTSPQNHNLQTKSLSKGYQLAQLFLHLNPWKCDFNEMVTGEIFEGVIIPVDNFPPTNSQLYEERTSSSRTRPGFSSNESFRKLCKSLKLYKPVSLSVKIEITLLNRWIFPKQKAPSKFSYTCEVLLLNLE